VQLQGQVWRTGRTQARAATRPSCDWGSSGLLEGVATGGHGAAAGTLTVFLCEGRGAAWWGRGCGVWVEPARGAWAERRETPWAEGQSPETLRVPVLTRTNVAPGSWQAVGSCRKANRWCVPHASRLMPDHRGAMRLPHGHEHKGYTPSRAAKVFPRLCQGVLPALYFKLQCKQGIDGSLCQGAPPVLCVRLHGQHSVGQRIATPGCCLESVE